MKQIIKNTIAILNPAERKKALILMGLNLVVSILDIGFLACLLFIAQLYSGAAVKHLSFLPGRLLDRTSLWPIGFFFLLFSAKNFASFFIYRAQSRFRYAVALRISYQNLLRYFDGGYSRYVDVDTASHFSQINLQPGEFSEHIMEGLQEIFTKWALIILTVAAILLFNAKLFLLLLLLLFPPMVIAAWMTRRHILAAKANIASHRRSTMQRLEESVAAFVEANLYDRKLFFSGRYYRSQREQNKHLSALRAVQGVPTRLAEVFAVFGFLALIGIELVAGHGQGTGFVTLGAFLAAAYKIIPGIASILNLNGQMRAYAYTLDDLVAGAGESRTGLRAGWEPDVPGEATVRKRELDVPGEATVRKRELDVPGEATVRKRERDVPGEATVRKWEPDVPGEATVRKREPDVPGEATVRKREPDVPGEVTVRKREPDVPGEATVKKRERDVPGEATVKKIGSITLRDISFRYDQRYVLERFDLHIETGSFLGIEGDSGRGKTTLLHLLLGFLPPERGEVLFNGVRPDREERRGYWRDIAYVKQQPLILQDTLRTNVTLGEDPEDEERLEAVLAFSGLGAVAEKLPDGLETRIAENGRNISGGQRQRIAIARALYKNPGVYILDEPFSELDEASEELLLGHFQRLSREGKIVILITHNKKSLGWCSQRVSLYEEKGAKTSARNRTFFL